MRPVTIPKYINSYLTGAYRSKNALEDVNKAYNKLLKGKPEVSIVMPAYNEEENIVPTLASLCNNTTSRSVEIIVVNNNSKDDTENLVKGCGVTCILETTQGITPARNTGLANATGKYVLNADADTIYPKDWIEEMIKPLANDEGVAITYGRFAFIPIGSTGRYTYFFYEYFSDLSKLYNKHFKTEAVNVYEVLDYHTDETFPYLTDVLQGYKGALGHYRKQEWDKALNLLNECLKMNPNDKLSQLYVERATLMKANPPGDDWNGVWVLKSK